MSFAIRKMPLGLRLPSTRLAWIVTALLLLLGTATAAYGFWASITSSSNGAAAADSLAPGSRPAVSATGTAVSVTWAGGTTANGHAATGYTVTRYASESGGTGTAATGGCAGTVTTLTCSEQNVPGGTWYYTVTPTISLWTGAESPRSTGISSDSAAPTVSVSPLSPAPNAAGWNNTSPVTFTITADDGASGSGVASITYTLDGGAQQTVSSASATVTVSGDGTHTVSYFATDRVGNTGAAQTQTVRIDTTAPAAPVFTTVPPYVFSGNVNAVTLKGTAEIGAKITLTASNAGSVHSAPPATATADGTGNWTASMNLSSLDQGTVTYSAVATDAAGNVGPAGTARNTKDTNGPAAAQSVRVPTYINAAAAETANTAPAASVPVSGTAEANSTVTLKATDSTGNFVTGTAVASDSSGVWSLRLNLGSNSGLVDGTVTYTITVDDPAGNTGSPVTPGPTSIRDTVAPKLTMDTLNTIYSVNVGTYKVSGTTDSSAPVNLTVTDSTTTVSGSGSGFTWAISELNLSALKETKTTAPAVTVSVTATTNDAAGNSTTLTRSVLKDTQGPSVTGITMGNKSGTAGKGDTVTITYSEAMDSTKFCPNWNGSSLDGTATLSNGADVTNDTISFTVTVLGTPCAAPTIGTILLGGDYVNQTAATFGSIGSASSLTWNLETNSLSIKLGNAPTGQGLLKSSVASGTPMYTYAPTLTDMAGNPLGAGTFKAAIVDASGF